MKRFLKAIDCTQQLKVRENVVGFEKALGAVKVIKDRIQYRGGGGGGLPAMLGTRGWTIFLGILFARKF